MVNKKTLHICLNSILLFIKFFCFGQVLEMGKWSYGNPVIHNHLPNLKVKIGNYCSIAKGVNIILGADHHTDWISTYPFMSFWPEAAKMKGHPCSKGSVIIENDVWIGMSATILSGVKIGSGAVIGCHAVVAKDIPPYAIAVGNPARVVKYRFDEETIRKLLAIAWWDWPENEVIQVLPLLLSDNIMGFIEYCEANGKLPQ